MIITGVADRVPERLARVVYLDASVPVDGESSYDAEFSSGEARAGDRAAAEAAGMPGFLVVDPYVEWIKSLLPDPDDRAWVFEKLVPQPIVTYTQPITLGNPAAAALPSIFVRCTESEDTDDNGNPSWLEARALLEPVAASANRTPPRSAASHSRRPASRRPARSPETIVAVS